MKHFAYVLAAAVLIFGLAPQAIAATITTHDLVDDDSWHYGFFWNDEAEDEGVTNPDGSIDYRLHLNPDPVANPVFSTEAWQFFVPAGTGGRLYISDMALSGDRYTAIELHRAFFIQSNQLASVPSITDGNALENASWADLSLDKINFEIQALTRDFTYEVWLRADAFVGGATAGIAQYMIRLDLEPPPASGGALSAFGGTLAGGVLGGSSGGTAGGTPGLIGTNDVPVPMTLALIGVGLLGVRLARSRS